MSESPTQPGQTLSAMTLLGTRPIVADSSTATGRQASRGIPSRVGRRQFIRILAAGAGATLGVRAVKAIGTRSVPVQETRLLMGSVANLTVLSEDRAAGQAAVGASFERMLELEAVLSRFASDSQLSRLNRVGRVEVAHPALVQVVARAVDYGALTAGAFDISIEPVLQIYRRHAPEVVQGHLPSLMPLVDYRNIAVKGLRIELRRPDMAITLDGIAKGYVIDEGVATLRRHGFEQVLVEVGGDLMAGVRPVGGWRIGIQTPRPDREAWIATAELEHSALATSGDYMNAFTRDYRLHHILDPRSGLSPAELASVSVLAPTAMDADALSTALMVLGSQAGIQLIERLPGVEALTVGKDLTVRRSRGFPARA